MIDYDRHIKQVRNLRSLVPTTKVVAGELRASSGASLLTLDQGSRPNGYAEAQRQERELRVARTEAARKAALRRDTIAGAVICAIVIVTLLLAFRGLLDVLSWVGAHV